MKHVVLVPWILRCLVYGFLGSVLGCGINEVDIPSTTTVTVPDGGILGENPLLPDDVFPVDLIGDQLSQAIKNSFDTTGYDKNKVSSLKMTLLELTVLNPQENETQVRGLGFLDKLTVYLGVADSDPIKCAESEDGAFDQPARGPEKYSVPVTGSELADAFKQSDALDMTADVDVDQPPALETDVQIDVVMHVIVDPFG